MRTSSVLVVVAAVALLVGVDRGGRPARAAEPAAATDEEAPRDPDPAPAPRAEPQRDDEGAPGASLDQREPAAKSAAAAGAEDRPFWKSWIFWTVAGVLVVGGAALAVHSASGSAANLEPCPGNIAASLGCFGAGRGQ